MVDDQFNNLVASSRTERTNKQYSRDWSEIEQFAAANSMRALPASFRLLACYLLWLKNNGKGRSVNSHLAAIRAIHTDVGYDDRVNSRILQAAKGLFRIAMIDRDRSEEWREPFQVEALWIPIGRSNRNTCPIRLLDNWIEEAKL